ncbi:hypothetical protein HN747_01595 [archaeon]|jgi:hypothetical protein|nr:hypothetical protein [archaeon]
MARIGHDIRGMNRKELDNLRGQIQVDIGGEVGVITAMIKHDGHPTGGYSLLVQGNSYSEGDDNRNPIVDTGKFFPVEDIGPRLKQEKRTNPAYKSSLTPAPEIKPNTFLIRDCNIYRFSKGNNFGTLFLHPDNNDYKDLRQRLEEFNLD